MNGVRRPLGKDLSQYCTPEQWATIAAAVKKLEPLAKHTWQKGFCILTKLATVQVWENGRPVGRAGMADLIMKRLELHTEIMPSVHPDRQKDHDETLLHEVGHFIAWFMFNDSGHGRIWKGVMDALGSRRERCHAIPALTGRSRRRLPRAVHEWECLDCHQVFRLRRYDLPSVRHGDCKHQPHKGVCQPVGTRYQLSV